MGGFARAVRRGAVPRGIVERRIHQHDIGAVGDKTRGGKGGGFGCDIEHDHLRVNRIGGRIAARQFRKAGIDLDQIEPDSGGPRLASASPAAPTPAPNSTTRSPRRAAAAAASSMASWPAR